MSQFLDSGSGPTSRAAPVYPPGPHCNVRGLTDLGRKLIDLMIDERLLIEVDHMSVKARDAVMEILRKRDYSGVLSGHEWSDKLSYKEILEVGGMVGGRANDVEGFVEDYERYAPMSLAEVLLRLGLRAGRQRPRCAAVAERGREPGQLSVRGARRRGDARPSGQRPADLRRQRGRDRPLRVDPRLGGGRPPRRRRGDRPRHAARRRGVPADLGARLRRRPRELPAEASSDQPPRPRRDHDPAPRLQRAQEGRPARRCARAAPIPTA